MLPCNICLLHAALDGSPRGGRLAGRPCQPTRGRTPQCGCADGTAPEPASSSAMRSASPLRTLGEPGPVGWNTPAPRSLAPACTAPGTRSDSLASACMARAINWITTHSGGSDQVNSMAQRRCWHGASNVRILGSAAVESLCMHPARFRHQARHVMVWSEPASTGAWSCWLVENVVSAQPQSRCACGFPAACPQGVRASEHALTSKSAAELPCCMRTKQGSNAGTQRSDAVPAVPHSKLVDP